MVGLGQLVVFSWSWWFLLVLLRVLGSVVRVESSAGSLSWSGSSAHGGLSVEKRSVERPVRRSSQSVGVRAWHQGRGLEAPLCQLCRTNLRVRVESAGESSLAPRKARAQPRLSELPWGQTSRLAHQGTTRVQVTCNGLVGPVRLPRLHVIKVYDPVWLPCL